MFSAPGIWPALRGVFADSLETKYQGAWGDRGFGSQEVLFLWDLWQFPTGRNQEKLFFFVGLGTPNSRGVGPLGCWSYDVSICINSKSDPYMVVQEDLM